MEVLLKLVTILAISSVVFAEDSPILTTSAGQLQGTTEGNTYVFKGIPFAQPPVGILRWKAPQPLSPWAGVFQAKTFGSVCAQGDPLAGKSRGQEDCLFLNVWTPKNRKPGALLPVMVWVHGGGFFAGGGGGDGPMEGVYNGTALVEKANVVYVSFNYRLGSLGFLSHPGLSDETAYHGSGNYGMLDQQAALKWVQNNIQAFGGDKANVTVFGQSAGGVAVSDLIVSPLSKGLFAKAFTMSGPAVAYNLSESEALGLQVSQKLGCTNPVRVKEIICLRNQPVEHLLGAFPSFTDGETYGINIPGPNVDNYFLPRQPLEIVKRGEHNKIPIFISNTAVEYGVFGLLPVSPAQYAETLSNTPAPLANVVQNNYRLSEYGSYRRALNFAATDYTFHCRVRQFAKALSENQEQPIYRYLSEYTYPNAMAIIEASHGTDTFLGFQTYKKLPVPLIDNPTNQLMADKFTAYWANFAAAGKPAPFWPAFTSSQEKLRTINLVDLDRRDPRVEKCEEIQAAIPNYGQTLSYGLFFPSQLNALSDLMGVLSTLK